MEGPKHNLLLERTIEIYTLKKNKIVMKWANDVYQAHNNNLDKKIKILHEQVSFFFKDT